MALERNWTYHGTVVKIIDADTIDISVNLGFRVQMVQRFRLLGSAETVDAYEMNDKDPEKRELARRGKDEVVRLVPVGEEVVLRTEKGPPVDGFGRWLAEVENASGVNVGDRLLDLGLAVPWRRSARR